MNPGPYEDQAYGPEGRNLLGQSGRMRGGLQRGPVFPPPTGSDFWVIVLLSAAATLLVLCFGSLLTGATGWALLWPAGFLGLAWFASGYLGVAFVRWRRMNYRYQYPRDLDR